MTKHVNKPAVSEEELDLQAGALTKAQRDSIRTHGLTERGVLLKVTASRFNNRRKDINATKEVCANKNASESAVQVSKVLVGKAFLEPVTKCYNRIRDVVRQHCLPWDGTGWVFVPIGVYETVRAELSTAIAAKDKAVEEVASQWEEIIAQQEQALGDLFNPSDYPNPDEFRASWNSSVDVQQIPSTDIRLDMDDNAVRDISNQVFQMVRKNISGAYTESISRLAEALENTANILNDKGREPGTEGKDDPGKRVSPVHDSLLENLRVQCNVVKAMGMSVGDADLVRLAKSIEEDLLKLSAETIRANPAVRERVGKKAAQAAQRAGRANVEASKKVDELIGELEDFA